MERHAVNAKQALELLESNNYSNESISELAGVLGTMEFKNDSFKKARRLTRQSLLAPNDNSLAQAEWIGREIDQISIEPWIDKIEYGYEARTFDYLYAKNYQKTLDEALHWVMDQPFSKRACHFVSYFCIGLTENYPLAIEVGELGAKSNPDHFPILNNLAFAYISSGDFVNAEGILEQLSKLVTDARTQCFALATTGYYYYRKKDIILGKEFYEKAIEVATGSNLQDLKKLAEANFLREKCIAGELSYLLAINALEKIKQGIKKVDLEEQLNHIAETITKKFHKVR
jgi:tetratricopeptide (TPR) repeat protein